MSSRNEDELQRKVEEVKQDADVQRALQQATATQRIVASVGRARARDKVWLGTQLLNAEPDRVLFPRDSTR